MLLASPRAASPNSTCSGPWEVSFTLVNSDGSLGLCVTLANVGTAPVTLIFDVALSQELVPGGTTRTRCKSGTQTVTAVCGGSAGTACKYLWRADLAS